MRYWPLVAAIVCYSWLPADAQIGSTSLVSPEAARPLGLERMWFSQFDLDRGRSRLTGMHLRVSNSEAHTVFELVQAGKRYAFSERDRDAFGQPIGIEGAKAKAEEKLAAIKADLEAAGKTEALPAIATHVVPKMTLYGTSDRGMVHALDAETGQTRWSTNVGNPLYPTTAPFASDKFVGLCNGSTLYILKAEDGTLAWSKMCLSAPGAGPALSDELVFVPMINGQIESYFIDDPKRPLASYRSFGRALVQPVLSFNSVAWPTDSGNIYVGHAHSPGMRYRVHTEDPITAPPAFLAPDKVVATSQDGYIYCIHEERGNILWRFTTGEPMSRSPAALGNAVYAITDQNNLFAVDATKGSELWVAPGIRHYVAGNDKRLYCTDLRGNLAILDAASGSRLGTLAAGLNDMTLLNAQTDRIFLATGTGGIQCLREANRPFPLVHYRDEANKPAQTKKTPAPKSDDKTEPTPTPTPTGDPFTDPFAPKAGAAPAPAAAPAADPFAAPPAMP